MAASQAAAAAARQQARWEQQLRKEREEEIVMEQFDEVDADGDGVVSVEEFKKFATKQCFTWRDKRRAERKAEEMFKQMDADGDGVVDAEEFKKWVDTFVLNELGEGLELGATVRIEGLVGGKIYNGKEGEIIEDVRETKGRWRVKVPGVLQALALKPDNLRLVRLKETPDDEMDELLKELQVEDEDMEDPEDFLAREIEAAEQRQKKRQGKQASKVLTKLRAQKQQRVGRKSGRSAPPRSSPPTSFSASKRKVARSARQRMRGALAAVGEGQRAFGSMLQDVRGAQTKAKKALSARSKKRGSFSVNRPKERKRGHKKSASMDFSQLNRGRKRPPSDDSPHTADDWSAWSGGVQTKTTKIRKPKLKKSASLGWGKATSRARTGRRAASQRRVRCRTSWAAGFLSDDQQVYARGSKQAAAPWVSLGARARQTIASAFAAASKDGGRAEDSKTDKWLELVAKVVQSQQKKKQKRQQHSKEKFAQVTQRCLMRATLEHQKMGKLLAEEIAPASRMPKINSLAQAQQLLLLLGAKKRNMTHIHGRAERNTNKLFGYIKKLLEEMHEAAMASLRDSQERKRKELGSKWRRVEEAARRRWQASLNTGKKVHFKVDFGTQVGGVKSAWVCGKVARKVPDNDFNGTTFYRIKCEDGFFYCCAASSLFPAAPADTTVGPTKFGRPYMKSVVYGGYKVESVTHAIWTFLESTGAAVAAAMVTNYGGEVAAIYERANEVFNKCFGVDTFHISKQDLVDYMKAVQPEAADPKNEEQLMTALSVYFPFVSGKTRYYEAVEAPVIKVRMGERDGAIQFSKDRLSREKFCAVYSSQFYETPGAVEEELQRADKIWIRQRMMQLREDAKNRRLDTEVQKIFDEFDTDGNGELDDEEFVKFATFVNALDAAKNRGSYYGRQSAARQAGEVLEQAQKEKKYYQTKQKAMYLFGAAKASKAKSGKPSVISRKASTEVLKTVLTSKEQRERVETLPSLSPTFKKRKPFNEEELRLVRRLVNSGMSQHLSEARVREYTEKIEAARAEKEKLLAQRRALEVNQAARRRVIKRSWRKAQETMVENQMNDVFDQFDTDNNGVIDASEFHQVAAAVHKALGLDKQSGRPATYGEIQQLFKNFDQNGDSVIDRHEFRALTQAVQAAVDAKDRSEKALVTRRKTLSRARRKAAKETAVQGKMHDIFDQFDTNGNGVINANEFHRVAGAIYKALGLDIGGATYLQVQQLFNQFDQNGDGVIDRREFRALVEAVEKAVETTKQDDRARVDAARRKALWKAKRKAAKETEVERNMNDVFDRFDTDGNGVIDSNEFHQVAQAIQGVLGLDIGGTTYRQVKQLFSNFDTNNDGVIDRREFRALTEAVEKVVVDKARASKAERERKERDRKERQRRQRERKERERKERERKERERKERERKERERKERERKERERKEAETTKKANAMAVLAALTPRRSQKPTVGRRSSLKARNAFGWPSSDAAAQPATRRSRSQQVTSTAEAFTFTLDEDSQDGSVQMMGDDDDIVEEEEGGGSFADDSQGDGGAYNWPAQGNSSAGYGYAQDVQDAYGYEQAY